MESSFVDLLKRFLKDLGQGYGDQYPELDGIQKSVALFATAFPGTCVDMFGKQVVQPFDKHIQERDEAFFTSDAFWDGVESNSLVQSIAPTDSMIRDVIGTVRSAWASMTAEDKDKVWQYMQGLAFLCKRARQNGD